MTYDALTVPDSLVEKFAGITMDSQPAPGSASARKHDWQRNKKTANQFWRRSHGLRFCLT
jgi:hypothetical protein